MVSSWRIQLSKSLPAFSAGRLAFFAAMANCCCKRSVLVLAIRMWRLLKRPMTT